MKIEDILKAYGYQNIIIVDPQDLDAMQKAVDDALNENNYNKNSSVNNSIINNDSMSQLNYNKSDQILNINSLHLLPCLRCRNSRYPLFFSKSLSAVYIRDSSTQPLC